MENVQLAMLYHRRPRSTNPMLDPIGFLETELQWNSTKKIPPVVANFMSDLFSYVDMIKSYIGSDGVRTFGDDLSRKQVIIKRDPQYSTCPERGSGLSYTILIMFTSASRKIHIECLPPHSTTILQQLDGSLTRQIFSVLILELSKSHLLADFCSEGSPKAVIYPFEKRTISKEKLLLPVSTSDDDETAARANTIDDVINVSPTLCADCHVQILPQ
ncbi:unnamed protein product, partial [Adineta ricciae]